MILLLKNYYLYIFVSNCGFPGSSAGKRMHLQCRRPGFNSQVGKIHWRRDRLATPVFQGFPGDSDDNESVCIVGDLGLIPGLGRSPGEGNGYPFQYSCLENYMDRGAWQATVHGVAKSWTRQRLSLVSSQINKHVRYYLIYIKYIKHRYKPKMKHESQNESHSVMSNSLRPHGIWEAPK